MASKEIPQGKTLPRSPQGPLTRSARKRAEEAAARRRLQQQDLDANPDAENDEQEDADEEDNIDSELKIKPFNLGEDELDSDVGKLSPELEKTPPLSPKSVVKSTTDGASYNPVTEALNKQLLKASKKLKVAKTPDTTGDEDVDDQEVIEEFDTECKDSAVIRAKWSYVYKKVNVKGKRIMNSIKGFKSNYTASQNVLDNYLNMFVDDIGAMTFTVRNKIDKAVLKMDNALSGMEEQTRIIVEMFPQYQKFWIAHSTWMESLYLSSVMSDIYRDYEYAFHSGARQPEPRGEERRGDRSEYNDGFIPKEVVRDIKPQPLEKNTNMASFSNWYQRFKTYYYMSKINLASREQQMILFRSFVSADLYRLIESKIKHYPIFYQEDDEGRENSVMKVLKKQIEDINPVLNDRLNLFKRSQTESSTVQYVANCRSAAITADIASMDTQDVLGFLILKGMSSKECLMECLKLNKKLTPDAIDNTVRIFEANSKAVEMLSKNTVHSLTSYRQQQNQKRVQKGQSGNSGQNKGQFRASSGGSSKARTGQQQGKSNYNRVKRSGGKLFAKKICYVCGWSNHLRNSCRFRNKSCNKCGKKGHLAQMCQKLNRNQIRLLEADADREDITEDEYSEDDEENVEEEDFNDAESCEEENICNFMTGDGGDDDYCYNITNEKNFTRIVRGSSPKIDLEIEIAGNLIKTIALADSGSTSDVISQVLITRYEQKYAATTQKLFTASGKEMKVTGIIDLLLRYGKYSKVVTMLISPELKTNIVLSWNTCKELHILELLEKEEDDGSSKKNMEILESSKSCSNCSESVNTSLSANRADFPPLEKTMLTMLKNEDMSQKIPQKKPVLSDKLFNLLKEAEQKILEEYKDIISDTLQNRTVRIKPITLRLKKGAKLTHEAVTVKTPPIHTKKASEAELRKQERNGAIKQVYEPMPTLFRVVYVYKDDGSIRITVNFQNLDLERPFVHYPTIQDLLMQIPQGNILFGKLDILSAFHQIPLSEESQKLTCFNTHIGKFVYRVLPQGTRISPDIWNIFAASIFPQDLCLRLADDILLWGKTLQELIKKIRAILDICRKHNVVVSRKKFKISTVVTFGGYQISPEGISVDPEKIENIQNFKTPQGIRDVRSLIGLVNQFQAVSPDLSQICMPIRSLLKKDTKFEFGPSQQAALSKIKEILTQPPVLGFFDPKGQTEIFTDGSKLGLGFVMFNTSNGKKHLITCGSRSISPCESRWSTSEIEYLGIRFALQRCKPYVFGCKDPITVITDHAPLVQVHKKQLNDITNPRLYRIREQLLQFNFNVVYKSGATNYIADYLSRNPFWKFDYFPGEFDQELIKPSQTFALHYTQKLTLQEISDAALKDQEYQDILLALKNGVKNVKNLPETHPARLYASIWHNLSVYSDPNIRELSAQNELEEKSKGIKNLIVLDNSRLLIPKGPIRDKWAEVIHQQHSGIELTKKLARSLYFFAGMNEKIKKIVENCQECRKHLPSQATLPRLITPTTVAANEHLGIDLFYFEGINYLLIADRFSGYLVVYKLHSMTANALIEKLDDYRYRYGDPRILRGDNAKYWISEEFNNWAKELDIKVEISSSFNQSSNGQTERNVGKCKRLLSICKGNFKQFQERLRILNNSPRSDNYVPSTLFFGRVLRGNLPTIPQAHALDLKKAQQITQDKIDHLKRQYEKKFNKKYPKSTLEVGQRVLVQDVGKSFKPGKWTTEAVILKKRDTDRSFVVRTDDGKTLMRNRRYLRPLPHHVD